MFGTNIIVEIEALEEAFAHVVRNADRFRRRLNEINRPLGGVQNDAAILTSGKMLFDFAAKLRTQLTVNIFR